MTPERDDFSGACDPRARLASSAVERRWRRLLHWLGLRLTNAARQGWPVFVLAWLVIGVLVAVMLVTTGYGAQDMRTISVFSADEYGAVGHALRNVSELNLDPHGAYYYGYLYPELAVLPLQMAKLLGLEVTPRMVIVLMRLLSVAFYLAALVFTRTCSQNVFFAIAPSLRSPS